MTINARQYQALQEAWLLKQLYVERRFGRRNRKVGVRKKVGK